VSRRAAVARLLDALRASFAAHADPVRAPAMQAYMKSALPFHGIATPLRRELTAAAVRDHALPDAASLAEAMRTLWQQARYREERYAALELGRTGVHARLFDLTLLPVYRQMIVDGAWWDYCDDISGTALARLLREQPHRLGAARTLVRRARRGESVPARIRRATGAADEARGGQGDRAPHAERNVVVALMR
jgi:3-methyladenine DNA glycosylase AlkD